eukprot:CAMPEP_0116068438 /NCGR_PEP_ID=MMETSP0322-20121206/11660_1 /TAXON_ID=163516 /ORGANISM="Leptocylindrus danicus var. apora, Strain B651" /LENGTH=355 /DNA_ID=CAMNT_0003555547 /DNA_START=16 /DNA_END=1080 /DNA_ORIENTATION=+
MSSSSINHHFLRFAIATCLVGFSVHGCSPPVPCGIIATDVLLTNVPNIVHVQLNAYESECDDVDFENVLYDPIDQEMLEIEVETGVVRTESDLPWVANATNEDHGLDLPTVNQEGYSASYELGSDQVSVSGFGNETLVYTLSDFDSSQRPGMYEGLIYFYSEAMGRFFFVYPSISSAYKMASCTTDESLICSEMDDATDFFDVDKSANHRIKVYDSLQLVGLPVVCCLCVEYHYFVFDENSLVKKVEVLGNALNPIAVDERVGMAYGVRGGYDQYISVISESINVVEEVDISEDILGADYLKQIFEAQAGVPTTPPIASSTASPVTSPVVSSTASPVVSSTDSSVQSSGSLLFIW